MIMIVPRPRRKLSLQDSLGCPRAQSLAFVPWVVRVMLVPLSSAARNFGGSAAGGRAGFGRVGMLSEFLRVLPILPRRTWTAKPVRIGIFAGHSSGPADNPGCGCSGRCFPADLVRVGCDPSRTFRPFRKLAGRSPDLLGCVGRAVRVEACSFQISFR